MSRKRNKDDDDDDNGFAAWGGYMGAKKTKLMEQFSKQAELQTVIKQSDIFSAVAIFVNGLTDPTAEELKSLMVLHGGVFHHYQVSATTHIIASNLPNFKIKKPGHVPIVRPGWITESIKAGRLLDYRKYLLYTNESKTQPTLDFKKAESRTLTASDPKFLSEFYNNSRLHLISTLGAEFKQLVADWRDKSNGTFPGKEKLIKEKGKKSSVLHDSIVMHIDMDCFFVSVGLRNRPELRGKPVAVTHSRGIQSNTSNHRKADRAAEIALYKERLPEGATNRLDSIDDSSSLSEIASCSYEARKCGIRNGMFMGTALKLCPDLKAIPYDFQGYREVSSTLYRTMASYTLDIEAVSCDEMYVDISQILRESGLSVDEWATHIRNEIMQATGCPCSTGFGANRLQARLATKKVKPSGQFYLKPDDVAEYMSYVPLSDLPGVGHATLAKLKKLQFEVCGDILGAPLSLLQNELGQKSGEVLFAQANGNDNRPLNFHHERKSVSAEVNYGIRFKTKDECLNFLQSLSNEVHVRLVDTGRRARSVMLKLMVRAKEAPEETAKFMGHGVCDSLSRSSTGVLISDANAIYKEVKQLYDRLNVPFNDLRGIGIQLTKLEKAPVTNKALSDFLNNPNMNSAKKKVVTDCVIAEGGSSIGNKSERTVDEDKIAANRNTLKNVVTNKVATKVTGKHSKRGRPPKSAQIKSTPGLNKYFQKEKLVSLKEISAKLKGDIDLKVLNELPTSLRDEIIKEYGLTDVDNKAKPKQKTVAAEKSSNETKCEVRVVERVDAVRNDFERLTWDEFKLMLKQWLCSVDSPIDYDVNLLGNHLKQMAIDRKTEVLHTAFKFLHRQLSDRKCGSWHRAYRMLVDSVQEGMVARYGNTLMIDRGFQCCK